MPSRGYSIVVGKLFEDVEFLQELKLTQLIREAQVGDVGVSIRNMNAVAGPIKRKIKSKYGIDLNKEDLRLLLEKKGPRRLNKLDIIFDARLETGTVNQDKIINDPVNFIG